MSNATYPLTYYYCVLQDSTVLEKITFSIVQ